MSAATAQPLVASEPATSVPAARRFTQVVLGLTAALVVATLALSLIPSTTLAGRLMGAAGEARNGAFAQEFATYADERLRLVAGVLLLLLLGLVLLRAELELLTAGLLGEWRLPRVARPTAILVGIAIGAALAVRLVFLSQPMRYDEALTFNEFASRRLYYGLSFYPDPNNHLLNTLLMHLAYVGLGSQPWVLRLPALLGGVLLVAATYWLARELFDARAAFLAAALVAVSSYLVEYSTNGRGYTLQALCFVVMLALVVNGSRRALLLAAAVAAVGAYAVPTMLYGVAVAAAWLLLRRGRDWRLILAAGLVLGLVAIIEYLPVIVVSGPDKLVANRFVVPLGIDQLPGELAHSLARTWAFWNRDIPLVLVAALLFGFVVTTWDALRKKDLPLGLLAPIVCLLLVLVQRVAPFERVWLFLLPLYLTLAAAGLARFVDGRLLGAGIGLVLGYFTLTSGSILSSGETGAFADAEAVARTLAPRLAPDDAVMTQLPASLPELQYYFPRYGLPINVLVRTPEEAQNLWLLASQDDAPRLDGWSKVTEVERFSGSALFELRR